MAFQSDVIVVESVRIPIYRGDAAGGDLTDTYPNPTIAAGAVTQSKLATNSVGTNELQDGSVTAAKLVSISSLGIFPISDPSYIASGIITNAHIGGAAAIATSKLAEGHRFINDYENQLVSGIKFFSRAPRTMYVPLTNYDLVNKRYVDLRLLSGVSSSVGAGGGNVSGNGALNYVAKFISANRISTTIIYDAGNQVAVGTTSFNSTDRFTVSGNIALVDGRMVGQNIISGNNIGAGNIQFGHLASNSVQNSTILNAAISGNKIQSLSVLEGHLGNNAVTNGKLALASVSGNVIQSRSIQQGHLALESVSGNIIATDSIQQGHIADNAVGTNELINLAVTNGKLALASVSGNVIQSKAILNGHLALDSISGNVLGTDVVLQGHIADNAVGTNELIDLNVTTAKLANLSVTNGKLALASVSGNVIQSKAILNGHLALESVSGNVVGTDVILQGHIADNAIGTNEIIDLNVTTAKLANSSISGDKIQAQSIQQGHVLSGYVDLNTQQIVSGIKTFLNARAAGNPINPLDFTSKAYVDAADAVIYSNFSGVTGSLSNYQLRVEKDQISGYLGIGSNGKISILAVISGGNISANTILNGHLALDSISGNVLGTDVVLQGHIAADAVGTAEIIDLNVTTAKLANLSVTNGKIAYSAISGNVIQAKSILTGHIADAAISGNLIGAGAILEGHLGFTINSNATGNSVRDTITQSRELTSGIYGLHIDRGHVMFYSSLSGAWLHAQADHPATAESLGVVESTSGNAFVLVYEGLISGTRFNPGDVYFVSQYQKGSLSSTELIVSGISKPMLVGLQPNYGIVKVLRGSQGGTASQVDINTFTTQAGTLKNTITQGGALNTFNRGQVAFYSILSGQWMKANANHPATAEALGVVESVSGNNFTIVHAGIISGTRFTPGEVYYLGDAEDGALISGQPLRGGSISKPIAVGLTPNYGIVKIMRGIQVQDTTVTTSGTAGFILKYTSPTTYANSIMQESAQNVYVNGGLIISGTTQIGGNLVVQGINITGGSGGGSSVILPAASISGNYIAAQTILPGHMGFDVYKKNYIVNGDFKIWQRLSGNAFFFGDAYTTSPAYTADMWNFYFGQDAGNDYRIERESRILPPNSLSKYCYKICNITAAAAESPVETCSVKYTLEGLEVRELKDRYVTFSFWIRSNKTGNYSVYFKVPNIARYFFKIFTINDANTWEQKTITVPIDNSQGFPYTNVAGLEIHIVLVAYRSSWAPDENRWIGTGNYNGVSSGVDFGATLGNDMYIADAQLEIGSGICTPFMKESYGDTLRKCQRYLYVYRTDPASGAPYIGYGTAQSATSFYPMVYMPVSMRTTPSLSYGNVSNWLGYDGPTGATLTTLAVPAAQNQSINPSFICVQCVAAGGSFTQGNCALFYANTNNQDALLFSAEL